MTNKITLERGKVWNIEELEPNTIALDGAVRGPVVDCERNIYSFDHHENCIRHSTRSTCEQVLDAILLGLDPTDFTILINDVDGDTVLALWLLQNTSLASSDLVKDLVREVGLLDSHGPAYPVGALADQFHKVVMKAVSDSRRNKTYGTDDLNALMEVSLRTLSDFILNPFTNEESEHTRSFTITHTGKGFVMAESNSFIFDKLYAEGHTKAVAYMKMNDGSYAYTIGKKSEFVSGFPVRQILDALNSIEPGWGGGSTIGGAPRNADGSRSHMKPEEILNIINTVIG